MRNQELMTFLKEMSKELDEVWDVYSFDTVEYFNDWKNKIIFKLEGSYQVKTKRIESLNYKTYPKLKTILRDMYFKHNINKKKNKGNIEKEKLLKAREGNIDFELELAKMITGDNVYFPYRSSYYLTNFFQSLGYSFTHNGETRKEWVKERLEELNIIEIHSLLSNGLFRKKYYIDHINQHNMEIENKEEEINIDAFFNKAKKEFTGFIKNSIVANKPFDLSNVLDMNVNIELLFDSKANTKDKELNKLIEESKERFLSNDKQVGLEKLWDAFERLKTYFDSGKKKKQSVEKVLKRISENFDEEFIENEFKNLTKIGNNYRIRHHETDKAELSSKHINYFFFRMMSLIDLCLMYLNEEENLGD
ncbi:MAG: Unknown protein [uncultured Sulfurovum sp.]|uniref:Uncharacterized protein n=1 Tax=uncultured Sulfurovum sp. TaxID=269237 RepID=A0A6S6T574_9BACT|nr:MAG: Unknown protein [uncultured Sulfurovum sp.]